MNDEMIGFLLRNANPSIKRRVKSEILKDITPAEAADYQRQILQEPNIKRTIACQKENGWLGDAFHGTSNHAGQFENMETCVKYLGEKAVDRDTPVLKRAMDAFVTVPLDDLCYGTRTRFIDEFVTAGSGMNLIRCACIARAGYDDVIDISPQIQLALDSFRRVLEVDSVLDVSRPIKKGTIRVFNDNEKWPCRYHLDILAHTSAWKNEDNSRIIAESVNKLMKTDRPELMNLIPSSWIGRALGSLGGFPSQGFSIKTTGRYPFPITIETSKPVVYNLEYIEWFARCGAVPLMPALQEAVRDIAGTIGSDGVCRIPVADSLFKGWGPYGGLQLETDWKSRVKRDCDITFRALLILHYSRILE